MPKSTFLGDLSARIREAERIIADQNEYLSALRHLLQKEMAEPVSEVVTPAPVQPPKAHAGVDFKGKSSEIILALVQRSGESGTRPRDIAEILLQHKLMTKGSNAVHSHLSELKKRGLIRQKSEGLYVASAKPASAVTAAPAPAAAPKKAQKKRRLSPEGREAIRKALKARWAAVKKAKG